MDTPQRDVSITKTFLRDAATASRDACVLEPEEFVTMVRDAVGRLA